MFSKKHLLFFSVQVAAYLLMVPHAWAAVGCGATAHGTSPYDQTACGNTGPFPMPAVAAKAIADCQPLAPGSYRLAKDIGLDRSAVCITLKDGPVTLDFAGFKITGRIRGNDIKASGTHLYSSKPGGGIRCSDHSGTMPGCLFLAAYDPARGILEIDHLTLENTDDSSINSARNLYIDWGAPVSHVGPRPAVRIHHVTSISATGSASARITNVHLNFSFTAEFNNNVIVCKATAVACQGIVAFGPNAKVHNNKFVDESLAFPEGETARAVVCDSTRGCEVYDNYFDTQDSRAIRIRDAVSTLGPTDVHDNLIDSIRSGSTHNYIAAIHVCDPDKGSNDAHNYVIHKNTIRSQGGVVLMSRGCAGYPQFRDNNIKCTAPCKGLLAAIRTPAPGSSSTFELRDNDPVQFASDPQTFVEAGASAYVCNTGSARGRGKVTQACLRPEPLPIQEQNRRKGTLSGQP